MWIFYIFLHSRHTFGSTYLVQYVYYYDMIFSALRKCINAKMSHLMHLISLLGLSLTLLSHCSLHFCFSPYKWIDMGNVPTELVVCSSGDYLWAGFCVVYWKLWQSGLNIRIIDSTYWISFSFRKLCFNILNKAVL